MLTVFLQCGALFKVYMELMQIKNTIGRFLCRTNWLRLSLMCCCLSFYYHAVKFSCESDSAHKTYPCVLNFENKPVSIYYKHHEVVKNL